MAVSGRRELSVPAIFVFIIRDWFSISFWNFPLHDGHLIFSFFMKFRIFLLFHASAETSCFSSMILSALKVALHFEHFIVRSLNVSR